MNRNSDSIPVCSGRIWEGNVIRSDGGNWAEFGDKGTWLDMLDILGMKMYWKTRDMVLT